MNQNVKNDPSFAFAIPAPFRVLTRPPSVIIVLGMNDQTAAPSGEVALSQRERFSRSLDRLYQCCSERHAALSERFGLPQAELRCLMLFGDERYRTAKGIAVRLNIAKSRVTKIVDGLVKKGLVVKVDDPADSRVTLLALTPPGRKKRREIEQAMDHMRQAVLEGIDPARRESLLDCLDTLKATMERVGEGLE